MNNQQDTNTEPGPYQDQTRGDKNLDQTQIRAEDWPKMIGKIVVSKEGLDMGTVIVDDDDNKDYKTSYTITMVYGDRERFRIPKETIYKVDKKNLYTSLTENEILASRKDDPFWTSERSYTHD